MIEVLSGPLAHWDRPATKTSLTLGVFDGVHLGHRALLAHAFKTEGLNTVVTFDPHPVEVLAPGTPPRLLTTIGERLDLLEEAGAELVAVLDLSEVRTLEPAEFVSEVLVDRMNIGAITVGEDFRFGRDRAGDVAFLKEMGDSAGFDVDSIGLVTDGEVISSTRIRALIEVGDVSMASELLGGFYRMRDTVVPGDKRGRELGFPTANLRPVPEKVLPADGVYATFVDVDGQRLMGATNVGTRPTFGAGERLVEAFILDFDADLYGRKITIEFVSRIRPELAFDRVDDLVDRMASDVEKTKKILSSVMG